MIADILDRLGRNETLRDYEAPLLAKDGSIRHVLINSNVRWGPGGEFIHTRCFTRDITDRKLAELALAELTSTLDATVAAELERTSAELERTNVELERANAELKNHRELLLEAQRVGQIGSWEFLPELGEASWSEELDRILGFEPGVIAPSHDRFEALVHPDDRSARLAALADGLPTGEPFSYQFRIVRADGEERLLSIRAQATLAADGTLLRVLGTAQDLTEAKRAEDERRQFEARLQESQRLESLGMLAGGIAHDFNNLLVGVLGNASLALEELPPDSRARARIADVELAARRAGDLTRQILAYSGKGSFVVEPVDLVGLVEEMGHLMEAVVSKNVLLEYGFGPERPVIEADATQLRQVVMNLIVNAAEASGSEHGRITVRAGVVSADREYLESFVLGENAAEGDYGYLEVSDTGAGMSPSTLVSIFDPFYSSKGAGRGLGLAGVLGIVRAHGGAVRVESELGEGSTFMALLPLSHAPVPLRVQNIPSPRSHASGTILVVDDERVIREVTQAMLVRAGFTVLTCSDGEEAVVLFQERDAEIDAVVLDLMMPGLSGDEVLRSLRAIRPDLPVVVSSGYTAHALDGLVDAVGEVAFLQKPYTVLELVGTVQKALATGVAAR